MCEPGECEDKDDGDRSRSAGQSGTGDTIRVWSEGDCSGEVMVAAGMDGKMMVSASAAVEDNEE